MHRIASNSGNWDTGKNEVVLIEQNQAPIVFLTAADTDIQSLANSLHLLPDNFQKIRALNILHLKQQVSIDYYSDKVLSKSKVIILRLLGGNSYWNYGLEVVKNIAELNNISLFVLPGDDISDTILMSHSTVPLYQCNKLWNYISEGGQKNWLNALKYISNNCFKTKYNTEEPEIVPNFGIYRNNDWVDNVNQKNVVILFYRSHYLSGNLLPIDSLCESLLSKKLVPLPIFVTSLKDINIQIELIDYLQNIKNNSYELLINTTSFSIAKIDNDHKFINNLWEKLDCPVLQVIFSSSTLQQWNESSQGLTPRDVAMNIALPEIDGKIITRAISFKSVKVWNKDLETNVVIYSPIKDRVDFVVDLTSNYINLKNTPVSERKIAIILANYPNKNGRIANGVGLDTPASCIEILKALEKEGYSIKDIPTSGDELIKYLTKGVTNDPESKELRVVYQSVSYTEYKQYFQTLPSKIKNEIEERWQHIFNNVDISFPISGIQLKNIFIGIQPSRGYDLDPSLNYHAPDLEPTPHYLAYYYWLKNKFKASAIINIGKHGNLEWLPGKSLALSSTCYPEVALGSIPNFYPFIVNDPGEGAQAKRRSHATIIDHLTPPLTRAELYDDLEQLEILIDEYYEAQALDPKRLKIITNSIKKLIVTTKINNDLGVEKVDSDSLSTFLRLADGYLCELKEAQIRDGLHVFGKCPQNVQLRDLILAIARSPGFNRIGLTTALAKDIKLTFNPLTANLGDSFSDSIFSTFIPQNLLLQLQKSSSIGDVVEVLEKYSQNLIENLINGTEITEIIYFQNTCKEVNWIQKFLIPKLYETDQEVSNLLKGLDGKYVPSGASGTLTRGKVEVLPTGRNFYSVDIRAIPTQTAWAVGKKAAEILVEKYTQDNGEYPKTLAISIWGTSTMRTGGDDIAQVFALLGVKPVWDRSRVIDYEIIPLSVLGRPRVDVTVRISGFFRDSFPNLILLLSNIIEDLSKLEEEKDANPLAMQVKEEKLFWKEKGLTDQQAHLKSCYRIFGSKPGAYGAGLQGLIEAQNWQDDNDLARAYINWSCYAYDKSGKADKVPEIFEKRLKQLQIVLHNQDNREHDLLDSDDYYQFQGGLTVAIRSITGKNPQTYFGDNSIIDNPKVKLLKEEISKVYRSRVVNPKWIKGIMRHGYKGGFEMAATVDYLFAYDATANCVEDFMYEGIAQKYIFDQDVRQFIEEKNPWALRDISERLLEANQRGLWADVNEKMLDELREVIHEAERIIEE